MIEQVRTRTGVNAVSSPEPLDADLVARAVGGEREAFSLLLERHYGLIYRIAYKWCGQQSDAEDVAQDVCVKLATALAGFDGRAAFTSWLYRIVLNAVRDLQRRGVRRDNRHLALKDVSESNSPAEQEEAVATAELWQAVRQLPDKQRDAVLLVYAEEMTHSEAAAVLGVKEGTVSSYVHEARKVLKGLL